jgi:hypothetical protein
MEFFAARFGEFELVRTLGTGTIRAPEPRAFASGAAGWTSAAGEFWAVAAIETRTLRAIEFRTVRTWATGGASVAGEFWTITAIEPWTVTAWGTWSISVGSSEAWAFAPGATFASATLDLLSWTFATVTVSAHASDARLGASAFEACAITAFGTRWSRGAGVGLFAGAFFATGGTIPQLANRVGRKLAAFLRGRLATLSRRLDHKRLADGGTEFCDFLWLEATPLAGFDVEFEGTVANALDLLDVMPDLLEHAANLAVTAFR